jgi:hypothetical protein
LFQGAIQSGSTAEGVDVTITGTQTVQSGSEQLTGNLIAGPIVTPVTGILTMAGTFFNTNVQAPTYKATIGFTVDFGDLGTVSGQANTQYIKVSYQGKTFYKLSTGDTYKFDIDSNAELFNPVKNAEIAYYMTNAGKDWSSWKGITPRTQYWMTQFPK